MIMLKENKNHPLTKNASPDSKSAEVTSRRRRTAWRTCSRAGSTIWRSRCCPGLTASRRGSWGCATRRSSAAKWSPPSPPCTRGSPTWRKVVRHERRRKKIRPVLFHLSFSAHNVKVSYNVAVIHMNGAFFKCKKGRILLLGLKRKLLH